MSVDAVESIPARIEAHLQARLDAVLPPAARSRIDGRASFADRLALAIGTGSRAGSVPIPTGLTIGEYLSALTGRPAALGGLTAGSSLRTIAGSSPAGAVQTFLDAALRQAGDRYVWGAEAAPGDADPTAFDCSELVQWAAAQAGVDLPDGSWHQYLSLARQGREISVDEALRTPGALLFRFSTPPTPGGPRPPGSHVAISLGDGRTIEARGSRYGVGVFDAAGRGFTNACVIPGLGS
jgi:cell wall-associated NlpC family hydrolase